MKFIKSVILHAAILDTLRDVAHCALADIAAGLRIGLNKKTKNGPSLGSSAQRGDAKGVAPCVILALADPPAAPVAR